MAPIAVTLSIALGREHEIPWAVGTYVKLQAKTANTTKRDRSRALIILLTMMKGIGRIRMSEIRLAQVTQMSISPCL